MAPEKIDFSNVTIEPLFTDYVDFDKFADCDFRVVKVKDCLKKIDLSGRLLVGLINDILDMSKIEAGTLEFIYSDTDVNQIMRELEGIFRLRLEEADSPVRIVFEPCLPVCFIHTERTGCHRYFPIFCRMHSSIPKKAASL